MGKTRKNQFTAPSLRHSLKCAPEHYTSLLFGLKTFEFRKNDRNFKVLDELLICEFDPEQNEYTGRNALFVITHLLDSDTLRSLPSAGSFPKGFVIMSLSFVNRFTNY